MNLAPSRSIPGPRRPEFSQPTQEITLKSHKVSKLPALYPPGTMVSPATAVRFCFRPSTGNKPFPLVTPSQPGVFESAGSSVADAPVDPRRMSSFVRILRAARNPTCAGSLSLISRSIILSLTSGSHVMMKDDAVSRFTTAGCVVPVEDIFIGPPWTVA